MRVPKWELLWQERFRIPLMRYFVIGADGKEYGPFDISQVQQLRIDRRLSDQSMARPDGDTQWVAVATLPGIVRSQLPPTMFPPTAPTAALYAEPPRDPALGLLIPLKVDAVAMAAGYAALFSLIGIGAPVALALGIWALVRLRSRPGTAGTGRAWFAVIVGGLVTALILLLVIVAAIR